MFRLLTKIQNHWQAGQGRQTCQVSGLWFLVSRSPSARPSPPRSGYVSVALTSVVLPGHILHGCFLLRVFWAFPYASHFPLYWFCRWIDVYTIHSMDGCAVHFRLINGSGNWLIDRWVDSLIYPSHMNVSQRATSTSESPSFPLYFLCGGNRHAWNFFLCTSSVEGIVIMMCIP